MTRATLVWTIAGALLGALLAMLAVRLANERLNAPQAPEFVQLVDLSPFETLAVQAEGRIKSYHSFADSMVRRVVGPRPTPALRAQPSAFTYLDMLLRPELYERRSVIHVANKPIRQQIATRLERRADLSAEYIDGFVRTGMIAPALLTDDPAMRELLLTLRSDAVATARHATMIENALIIRRPETLADQLRIIPPRSGDMQAPWGSVLELHFASAAHHHHHTHEHDGHLSDEASVTGMNAEVARGTRSETEEIGWEDAVEHTASAQTSATDPPHSHSSSLSPSEHSAHSAFHPPDPLEEAWSKLASAWRAEDAISASAAIVRLAELLPSMAPGGVYPERSRLWWESWYYSAGHMTWVWLVYMLSIVFLLISVAHRWPMAARAGFTVFLIALALHTFAVGLRWHVSGRWPNANMFEAVTTSAWFGAAGALVLEFLARRTPMRCFFALGAAFCAAAALLAARLLPVGLDPGVGNMAPILHDVWLYIHTNVIIFSYCLIGMAAVSATLYMLHRLAGAAPDYARHGGAGAMMNMGGDAHKRAFAPGDRGFEDSASASMQHGQSVQHAQSGQHALSVKHAQSGQQTAASSPTHPLTHSPAHPITHSPAHPNAAQILDAVTMVLLELAFILLWAGIVMGAIWADHSWGRPWGWDPKEVFALNTFVIFVILIHVRMRARDKGLWTAALALFGFVSMLFNWIVINFVISGLHSYA